MSESFFRSFLAGGRDSQAFLPAHFRDRQARIVHARRAAGRSLAPGLLEVIRNQNQALSSSAERARNLEAIGRQGTAVVVTGQQLGLFLGPLYTVYKAATAISAARQLEAESGIRCVPIFWLQTEDHDFPEIDHCHILRSDGTRQTLRLTDRLGSAGQRVSVEHRMLGEECQALTDSLEECLENLPFAAEVLRQAREHYRRGHSLVRAFAGMLSAFFADDGLLIFDPREAAVSQLAAPIYRRALSDCEGASRALLQRMAALQGAGFETQVHVRSGCPLFFFHRLGPEGERYRLEGKDGAWTLIGGEESISSDALIRVLEAEPLRFSSSALLRPIVQDSLLPTAAYVAGPAEVSYFAQLPPLYGLFDVPMPLVLPRARFRCLEPKTLSLLGKLNLRPEELEEPEDALRGKLAAGSGADYPSADAVKDDLMNELSGRLERLQGIAQAVDPALLKAVERTRATMARAAERLSARYGRALLEKDRVLVDRLGRVRNLLFPGGVPQERWDSLPYFAAKYGPAFKERLKASLQPFAAELRDIQL